VINRLMREIGPLAPEAPAFPTAVAALAPLRARAPDDFASHWAGQAARLARPMPAGELTRLLAAEALARLSNR
jgi:nitronate monooxygenase